MLSSNPDDSQLLIRCPSCGQRFKVGEDLRERTVECGGCEHRFRIDDEVIVRSRKVYPGERNHEGLNQFQRVPLGSADRMIGVELVQYGNAPDPAVLEPVSPQRIIAGIVGAAGIILMALLLMFGNSRGGVLDGMDLSRRLMMGGFVAVMGMGMLIYANPRARLKAIFFGSLLSAGMMAVPFFFNISSFNRPHQSGGEGDVASLPRADTPPETENDKMTAALRNRIGTHPLELELKRLAVEGSDKRAVGLWLRGMSGQHRYLVRDYIIRVTKADPSSIFYPRDGGDLLMVVTGITLNLQEMAIVASALGSTEKIYPELSVIEVKVRNENFVEGPIEKLTDKEAPAFYDLNKRELESIDMTRVERAVQRLAEAAPKVYRTDITRKLIELLGDDAVEFKVSLCRALAVWSEDPVAAAEAALVEVKKEISGNKVVAPEVVALVVKARNPAIMPILDELWYKDPLTWESLYGDAGPAAEATLIKRFPKTSGTVRHSAVRILGRVGGTESLTLLKSATQGADSELRVLIEQAQKAIMARS